VDYEGKQRPLGEYDMGAFEHPFLRSDIDLDGEVDCDDLFILQNDWMKKTGP